MQLISVVTRIVGCAGLKPTVAMIKAWTDIALANKGTLIVGGPFVLPPQQHNIKLVTNDSEHYIIFQCIQGLPKGALMQIILTASGGAFGDWPIDKLKAVKVANAVKHSNCNMGNKIAVDFAILFNKRSRTMLLLKACHDHNLEGKFVVEEWSNVSAQDPNKLESLNLVGPNV
ncbi:hypothetical protein JHK82_042560 [Glycine max]|nr:hypothetical protein JHK85_043221 [Glycine max]KAG5105590.1 hypothetical protein JHK82_042560 [Glycine max]